MADGQEKLTVPNLSLRRLKIFYGNFCESCDTSNVLVFLSVVFSVENYDYIIDYRVELN